MAAPNVNTFSLPQPRRPSLADFNGAAKQDDPAFAPNVVTMPNSEEWNTMAFLLVALGQIIPTARVSVTAGATPSVTNVIAPGDKVNGNLAAFVLTRNGVGDYWVENVASTSPLPPLTSQPGALLNSTTAKNAVAVAGYGTGPVAGGPAIRVLTEVAGAAADVNFTAEFY